MMYLSLACLFVFSYALPIPQPGFWSRKKKADALNSSNILNDVSGVNSATLGGIIVFNIANTSHQSQFYIDAQRDVDIAQTNLDSFGRNNIDGSSGNDYVNGCYDREEELMILQAKVKAAKAYRDGKTNDRVVYEAKMIKEGRDRLIDQLIRMYRTSSGSFKV